MLQGLPFTVPVKELAPSGYRAYVQLKKCIGCGKCVDRCPFGAITLSGKAAQVDSEKCMGCGACIPSCPEDAICLRKDPTRGIPLDVKALGGKIRKMGDASSRARIHAART